MAGELRNAETLTALRVGIAALFEKIVLVEDEEQGTLLVPSLREATFRQAVEQGDELPTTVVLVPDDTGSEKLPGASRRFPRTLWWEAAD